MFDQPFIQLDMARSHHQALIEESASIERGLSVARGRSSRPSLYGRLLLKLGRFMVRRGAQLVRNYSVEVQQHNCQRNTISV